MSRACIEAKILLLKLQKSLGDNAAPKLAESSLIVSEAAEYLISHSQKLGVRSASEKLKTPFVCNAVKETPFWMWSDKIAVIGGASSTVSAGFVIAYGKLMLEPLKKKAEEDFQKMKLERHKELLDKLEEQKGKLEQQRASIEALKEEVDALKRWWKFW